YRMSDINASIGRQQLKRMGAIREKREANFKALKSGLANIAGISILDSQNKDAVSSFYCLSVVLEKPLDAKRIEIVKKLNAAGIGTSVYYPQPVPRMSYYQNKYGYNAADFAGAERISDQSIALPVGPHLTTNDMVYISQTFSSILKELN
ncbi:MAG: DegT/DnrJ/EryC1/StrS family aminotransferase, partial [Anaerolineales bacterium]